MTECPRPESGLTDEELIARVLTGDRGSYDVLVARHADLVYTIVLRILWNEDDADDVAQETFVRAYRALPRFRGDSKFSSWLYRIAVNRALTHLKRRKRRSAGDAEVADAADGIPGSEPVLGRSEEDPERQVLAAEERAMVREAVAKLPPRYRAVITLFYLEERSYKEVAGVLGVPVGTLKTHLHRARALLRDIMSEGRSRNGRDE
jgi:RNA polymerase sigma-70 factor (ECF subfamily)